MLFTQEFLSYGKRLFMVSDGLVESTAIHGADAKTVETVRIGFIILHEVCLADPRGFQITFGCILKIPLLDEAGGFVLQ